MLVMVAMVVVIHGTLRLVGAMPGVAMTMYVLCVIIVCGCVWCLCFVSIVCIQDLCLCMFLLLLHT